MNTRTNGIDDERVHTLRAVARFGIASVVFRNSLAKREGLTLTESLCLTMLGTRGPSTPTAIARFIGLTSGAATTLLDRLEKRRFISRRRNPDDRRGVIVEISEENHDESRDLVAGIREANRRTIQRYKAKELAVIRDFLERFAGNLEAETAVLERDDRSSHFETQR